MKLLGTIPLGRWILPSILICLAAVLGLEWFLPPPTGHVSHAANPPRPAFESSPMPALDPPLEPQTNPPAAVRMADDKSPLPAALPQWGDALPRRLLLRAPDGSEIAAQLTSHQPGAGGADVWTGIFEGEPDAIFSLAIAGEAVDGYGISERHGELQLTGTTNGNLKLAKLELEGGFCQTVAAAHYGEDAPLVASGSAGPVAAGYAQTIDILVVYTPLALQEAGTVSAVTAKANAMVNALNNYLSLSSIDVYVNLLGVAPVTHAGAGATSDGSVSTLLTRLQNATDGQMDEAQPLRDSYGADLVCVFGVCPDYGIANIGGPWAAADYSTANGVMPHEIGHNLGCGHNDSGTGQTNLRGVYSYSYAHYVDFPPLKGTLMTYIGTKTGRFSNPNVMWDGYPSGTATRDHARTISTFAPTVAGWRTLNSAPTITAIPNQTVNANTNTGPLAFTVGDDLTAPTSLTLGKLSSNLALVPVANIVFGGSGSNRTVTVTPATNQSGSAIISLIASDGSLSSTNRFTLTVLPAGAVFVSVTNNTPGTLVWICPPGVTNVEVECWGGGGAGGSARNVGFTNASAGGGGGAGGAYARRALVPVTPGNSYSVTIPAAAIAPDPASAADGAHTDGSAVSFVGNGGVTVTAAGGQGGATVILSAASNRSGLGGMGSTAGCVGDVGAIFAGGNGTNAASVGRSGAGGGGAGDANPGGNALDLAAGVGGVSGGGTGGTGKSGNGGGNAVGAGPGGGGGGGRAQTNVGIGSYFGASGGLGQIVLTYLQVPVERPVLGCNLSGGDVVLSWSGSGFKAQICTNLTEGIWGDVPGGAMSPVTISSTEPAVFFRLIEQ